MTRWPADEVGLLQPGARRGEIVELVDERSYMEGVLAFERALARASAVAGIIPAEAAAAIENVCVVGSIDWASLGSRAEASGSPVIPVIEDLCAAAEPIAASFIHYGATSQDAWDTATVLVARRVLASCMEATADAASGLAGLARREARTLMVGRTLGQHAGPYSLGLKAAGWCLALVDSHRCLRSARGRLAVQLGGATGTLAAFGEMGPRVRGHMAAELGLYNPVLPWHTNRASIVGLGSALALVASVWSKIATDVILLSQTEVGELRETGAGRGRSSAMPHKANAVRAIEVRAGALRAPGLLATLFAATAQENERGAGTWQAEWVPLRDLLLLSGSLALQGRDLCAALEVDRDRMRRNFALLRGLPMSEQLANRLTPHVGRMQAQEIVRELVAVVCADGTSTLLGAASRDPRVKEWCSEEELASLLEAELAPLEASRLVGDALAAFEASGIDVDRG